MTEIKRLGAYLRLLFSVVFCFRPKVFICGHPTHPNLGDQAQLMCTEKWLQENYPTHRIFRIGFLGSTLNFWSPVMGVYQAFLSLGKYLVLKFKVGQDDFFIGHSGYFMIDHHNGWKMFTDIIKYFPDRKIIIFPQTINFYTPYIRKIVSEKFSLSEHVTLMCRDEVSYKKAQDLFPKAKLLLMPDIVTTLIGSTQYSKDREGILFCLRNDIEAYYTDEQIQKLIERFENARVERTDTSLEVSDSYMKKNRDQLIWETIEKFSKFRLVITDRYHGTIFSAIAATPVVVINSADHKLSSGVKWFPEEFSDYVHFADDLESAYSIAGSILDKSGYDYTLTPYFEENYYRDLKSIL